MTTKAQWLHIHVLEGVLYVFDDDGHWRNQTDWIDEKEVTFKQLAGECCLGLVDDERQDYMFRIRLNPAPLVMKYTKFGMTYWEEET